MNEVEVLWLQLLQLTRSKARGQRYLVEELSVLVGRREKERLLVRGQCATSRAGTGLQELYLVQR